VKENKERRKKNKLSTIIVFIVIVILGCYIFNSIIKLIQNPTDTVFVKEGVISKEETAVGYIIRDEEVVKGDNYKNGMEQIGDEGQKVAKEESVFRYYSNGEDEIKNKISELDKEIEETMDNNSETIFSSDIKLLETQIDESLYKTNDLNNVQKIQEYKKTLSSFITKKAEIAGELSPKGSHLRELINERAEYQNQLREDSEYIDAPRSGILSYRIDGLEETLTTGDFSKYNKDFLSGLNIKTGQIIPTNNEEGKIVSNFESFIIFTSKTEEALNAEIGDNIKITLPNARTVDAEVYNIIDEENRERTITLKFRNGIDELLQYRKISFEIIWWNLKGYKVPNSAIITDDNTNYVIKTRMGYLSKIAVKVTKQTESYSIVSNYSASEIDELKLDSKTKTTIQINDELLLKPTKEQLETT